jgi:uncharacterized protein (TIGR02611 family)
MSTKRVERVKRYLKIAFGFTLLFLGVLMVLTPGPGWLVMVIGLGVLAAEYVWAQRLLNHMKQQGVRLREAVLSTNSAKATATKPVSIRVE